VIYISYFCPWNGGWSCRQNILIVWIGVVNRFGWKFIFIVDNYVWIELVAQKVKWLVWVFQFSFNWNSISSLWLARSYCLCRNKYWVTTSGTEPRCHNLGVCRTRTLVPVISEARTIVTCEVSAQLIIIHWTLASECFRIHCSHSVCVNSLFRVCNHVFVKLCNMVWCWTWASAWDYHVSAEFCWWSWKVMSRMCSGSNDQIIVTRMSPTITEFCVSCHAPRSPLSPMKITVYNLICAWINNIIMSWWHWKQSATCRVQGSMGLVLSSIWHIRIRILRAVVSLEVNNVLWHKTF